MASLRSRSNQPMVICRKLRVGTWSQSKMATNGEVDGLERGVDVAGLGVHVVRARAVADAGLKGELLELLAAAVVEDVDVQLVGGPIHVERAERGVADDIERLVVGGDEDVDVRPFFGSIGQRHGRAAQRPDGLKVAEKENDEGVDLGQQQS